MSFQGWMAKSERLNAGQLQWVLNWEATGCGHFEQIWCLGYLLYKWTTPKCRSLKQQWFILLRSLRLGQGLVETAYLCSAWCRWLAWSRGTYFHDGSMASQCWLLAPRHVDLSSELLELPRGVVAGFQEQTSQEPESGCSSFVKALVQTLALQFCHIPLVKQSQSPDFGLPTSQCGGVSVDLGAICKSPLTYHLPSALLETLNPEGDISVQKYSLSGTPGVFCLHPSVLLHRLFPLLPSIAFKGPYPSSCWCEMVWEPGIVNSEVHKTQL